MNITRKPNYIKMKQVPYLNLVLAEIEYKMTEEGMGLLVAGYDERVVSAMILDACQKFKALNLTPKFTANQIINLLVEKNLEIRKF